MEPSEHKQEAAEFRGRVLVAEDVGTNQVLMASLLGKLGLKVTIAADGGEAVQKASSEAFDLIFMDIQMPNMDGYQATKTLRQRGTTVPIIALTAHTEKGEEAKCLDAGCDDYLTKPIDRACLVERLRKYLFARSNPSGTNGPAGPQRRECGCESFERHPAETGSNGDTSESHGDPIIDWDSLVSRGFDEALVESIMPICIADNRKRLRELRSALTSRDVENIRLCAHAVKGSFAMMGVFQLAQAACSLEEGAKQGDLSAAEPLLSSMEKSLEALEALVSRPGWAKTTRRQAKSVTPSHRPG
ncbi:MAG: response regulator [Sedimentisphaerales bacterium]|nr:response regulator [Sedimentisphaerales bacterium]